MDRMTTKQAIAEMKEFLGPLIDTYERLEQAKKAHFLDQPGQEKNLQEHACHLSLFRTALEETTHVEQLLSPKEEAEPERKNSI